MKEKNDEYKQGFEDCKAQVLKLLHQNIEYHYESGDSDGGDGMELEFIDSNIIDKIKRLNP